MTDLEITKLCAEAMELISDGVDSSGSPSAITVRPNCKNYDPLHDDAQAMALVKKFQLTIGCTSLKPIVWTVCALRGNDDIENTDLNRAICECVAKLQKSTDEAHE